jgi:hypothetical protein
MTPESALVVLVPDADPLVRPFRERFDPSAAAGLGAHITLLYPFIEPGKIDARTLAVLAECFRCFAPITFSLPTLRRFFAETLYLAPEPDEPFRQLTLAIWERFPDTPPYRGAWPDIVPHLSVGRFADARMLDEAATDLATTMAQSPPVRALASTVVLIENTTGRWIATSAFELSS